MQAMIRKEFAAEITATVFVAMRRSFGWGTDRLMRLRKKMGMELDCLTDKYVKIEDLERIIRDELAWGFDIEDASDLDMESRTKYRTIRVMSAAFIVALHDEFGFGQKRAMRAYESLRLGVRRGNGNGRQRGQDVQACHSQAGAAESGSHHLLAQES